MTCGGLAAHAGMERRRLGLKTLYVGQQHAWAVLPCPSPIQKVSLTLPCPVVSLSANGANTCGDLGSHLNSTAYSLAKQTDMPADDSRMAQLLLALTAAVGSWLSYCLSWLWVAVPPV